MEEEMGKRLGEGGTDQGLKVFETGGARWRERGKQGETGVEREGDEREIDEDGTTEEERWEGERWL